MAAFKGSTFQDRATAAAEAKKALLEAFKNRPGPDDPAVQARMAERFFTFPWRLSRRARRPRADPWRA